MKMFTGQRKWQGSEHGWVKQHSLSLVLTALLTLQTVYAVWSGVYVWDREQPLGEGISSLGSEFWIWWSWEYNITASLPTPSESC